MGRHTYFGDPSATLPHDPNSAFSRPMQDHFQTTPPSYRSTFHTPSQSSQSSSRNSQPGSFSGFASLGNFAASAIPQFIGGNREQNEAMIDNASNWIVNSGENAINRIKESSLRSYFAVNNIFVFNKLRILLFPYLKRV